MHPSLNPLPKWGQGFGYCESDLPKIFKGIGLCGWFEILKISHEIE
jgi:hypothetical protein